MAGPKKNASKADGGRTTRNGALLLPHQQQKKMTTGWLYAATVCLEKIKTESFSDSWSDLALVTVSTYPFQKCSSRKHSPFMHACLLGKTELAEYYLSLYILFILTNCSIKLTENDQTFRQWLLSVNGKISSTCHILNEFDRISNNIGDDDMIHFMSGKLRSGWDLVEIVNSFLFDHPKRAIRINPITKTQIAITKRAKKRGKAKPKKRLPTINCQDSLDLDLDDVYSDDHYYDYDSSTSDTKDDEGDLDDYQGSTYETAGDEIDENSNQMTTTTTGEEESSIDIVDNDDEDALPFQWEDVYELHSLSDEEHSEDVISFNAKFVTELEAGRYRDVTSDVGDDWNAIPEIQSVISVDTFSGEKQIFSYKDALFVNKEEPKTFAPITLQVKAEAKKDMSHTSKMMKSVVDRRDESEESDLHGVYFDHDNAKLKGGQRRNLRELKGN